MTQDEQHLKLLSIFHYIVGGLTALFSCIPFFHIAIGIAMLCGAFDGEDSPPKFVAWFFILIAAVFILSGWTLSVLIILAGRKLRRRVSRTFCLVIGGLECMFMPFGTVLGVLTLVMLTKDSVKELFAANQNIQPTVGFTTISE